MRDPWAVQRWAFEQQTGNPTRKALLSMLAMMADAETGRCEAKQSTLAQGVEVSERSIATHVKALVEMGLLAKRAQFRTDRGRRGDEFLLLAPWVTEWPDGAPAGVHPADISGGPPEADGGPPLKLASGAPLKLASGQEQPHRNGQVERKASSAAASAREWVGVPEEMRRDAIELLSAKKRVGGRVVKECEMEIAAAALAEFNRQMESDYGLGANLTSIVMRIRDRPSFDAAKHVRLVQSAWRFRWWERNGSQRRATPQVVYGERAFENVVQDAADEAAGRKRPESMELRSKVWPDGRRWEELTRAEQEHAKESVAMGGKPWLLNPNADAPPAVLAASNGHRPGVTAENWLD